MSYIEFNMLVASFGNFSVSIFAIKVFVTHMSSLTHSSDLLGVTGYTIFQNPGRPLFLAGRLEWRWFLVYVEHVQLFGFRFSPVLFIRCLITVSLHRTVWFHTSKRSSSHWNVSPLCVWWIWPVFSHGGKSIKSVMQLIQVNLVLLIRLLINRVWTDLVWSTITC